MATIKNISFPTLDDKHAEITEAAKEFGSLAAYFTALHDEHVKSKARKEKQ